MLFSQFHVWSSLQHNEGDGRDGRGESTAETNI